MAMLPTDPAPSAVSIKSEHIGATSSVSLSNRRYTSSNTGSSSPFPPHKHRFNIEYQYKNLTRAQFNAVNAFIENQEGQYGTFDVLPPVKNRNVDVLVNKIKWSQNFNNPVWLRSGLSILTTLGADLTSSGVFMSEDNTTSTHFIYQEIDEPDNTTIRCSVYVKPSPARTWCMLQVSRKDGLPSSAWFDVGSGVLGTVESDVISAEIGEIIVTPIGSYWRCTIVVDIKSGQFTPSFRIYASLGDTISSYLGVGAEGVSLWGPSYSVSSLPIPYMETEVYTKPTVSNLHNYFPFSEDMSQGTGTAQVTANTFADPNGNMTIDTITDSSITAVESISFSAPIADDVSEYILTMLVRKDLASTHYLTASITFLGGPFTSYAGLIYPSGIAANGMRSKIDFDENYFLVSMVGNTFGNGSTSVQIDISPAAGNFAVGGPTVTGSTSIGWVRLEKAKFSSGYLKTVGTPITSPQLGLGNTLHTMGWRPNSTKLVRSGDYIKVVGSPKTYQVIEDVTSDATGTAIIKLNCDLERPALEGQEVLISDVPFTVSLDNDSLKWSVKSPSLYSTRFNMRETY